MSTCWNRRRFVKTVACATAALGPAIAAAASPASERVRLALIGCGARGRENLDVMQQFPDVEFVALSDVIEPRMDEAAKLLAEGPRAQKPERVVEYERILDRKDVDAVVIATQENWHGLPFIRTVQAGKPAYTEKPFSYSVAEGRAMVEAAKKAGVLAMMGSQQRGYGHFQKAVEIVRSGRLGKIALVECWNFHNTANRVGRTADAAPPPGYHWERWLGPAPVAPFNPARLNSQWFFAYGGGMLTTWGTHHLDVIAWAMQADVPSSAVCAGGKFVIDDLADAPDTIEASWEFPGFVVHYCYRGFNNFRTIQARTKDHGICFHGNKATLVLDRAGYELWEDRDPVKSVQREDNPRFYRDGKPGNETDGPWQRGFVDCLKQGKRPPLELEQSHRATVCCHLANIAYRTGHKVRWDGVKETIADDPAATALLNPPRRKGYELPNV
jgi:predicted dehydrogenase